MASTAVDLIDRQYFHASEIDILATDSEQCHTYRTRLLNGFVYLTAGTCLNDTWTICELPLWKAKDSPQNVVRLLELLEVPASLN